MPAAHARLAAAAVLALGLAVAAGAAGSGHDPLGEVPGAGPSAAPLGVDAGATTVPLAERIAKVLSAVTAAHDAPPVRAAVHQRENRMRIDGCVDAMLPANAVMVPEGAEVDAWDVAIGFRRIGQLRRGLRQTMRLDANGAVHVGDDDVARHRQWRSSINGIEALTDKSLVCSHVSEAADRFKEPRFRSAMPACFVVPRQAPKLKSAMERDPSAIWTLYPDVGATSTGTVKLFRGINEMPADDSRATVMEHIQHPLTINGLKSSLRVYVLVTSLSPLRVFTFLGPITWAATVWLSGESHLDERCMQMPVRAFQVKRCPSYVVPTGPDVGGSTRQGTPATHDPDDYLDILAQRLEELGEGSASHDMLLRRVQDVVLRQVIAAYPYILGGSQTSSPLHTRRLAYHVSAIDMVFDVEGVPWVVDTDCCPTIRCADDAEQRIQRTMLAQTSTLLGHYVGAYDRSAYESRLVHRIQRFCSRRDGGCSDLDIELLIEHEDQRHNSASFDMIYPTRHALAEYGDYVAHEGEAHNALLREWLTHES